MSEAIVVLVTAGNAAEATRIAESLVGDRLAACVNVVGSVRSIYRWQGEMCSEEEILLVVKTTRDNFAALDERVRELHSYDVPEVIALPIDLGSAPYLDWIHRETNRR
jgi:periplasmic divalent cation tolerance protein